jgi:UDP-N-acetylmuramoyl-L-alanyl-D-glutamate--2,6-diaminopimelate ligase
MQLDELTAVLAEAVRLPEDSDWSIPISSLAYDSRAVQVGGLFFCVPGFQSDGHEFAAQAIACGAVALVVERPLATGVPELVVQSARAAMGALAARFFGYPSRRLRVVGITGTNGKTTTAFLVRALLQAGGEQCGLLGTVKSIVAGAEREVVRTTPEAIDLQRDLAAMLAGGDRACAMEVSSHALELGRADGIDFAAAIFTNLSRDHLDFHDTMEDYFAAKRKLFLTPSRVRVVNVGDPYGARLAAELGDVRTVAVDSADADYTATKLRLSFAGATFTLCTPEGERSVSSPLRGRFNVANALGALAAAHSLGGDLDVLVAALERGITVPGRLQAVDEGQDFAALVDYAHTPDSLENVLGAARELAGGEGSVGRVLCVFGAGGDRDRGKRALMGEVARRLADIVLGDRRAAIEQALALARTGDVVVIAGKGHEQGQELADGRKIPFDDVGVVSEALARTR